MLNISLVLSSTRAIQIPLYSISSLEIQAVMRRSTTSSKSRKGEFIIMVSQTLPGQPPKWERLNTPYIIEKRDNTYQVNNNSNSNKSYNNENVSTSENEVIIFEVPHFSLYKAIWSCVDHVLPETIKLRASDSIPGFSFRTRFEARMTNCNNQKQFALCIQAYREEGRDDVLNEQSEHQYPLQVGSCSARPIKSGKLRIRYIECKRIF